MFVIFALFKRKNDKQKKESTTVPELDEGLLKTNRRLRKSCK
jgi:hypothetical protein